MATTAIDTTQLALRDIHLPDTLLWWPLAPGWSILIVTITLTALAYYLGRRYYRSKALTRTIAGELQIIKDKYTVNKNQHALIQSLSVLLRRSCISFYPRHETAGLTGDTWLKYLDSTSPRMASTTTTFYNGIGEVLAIVPYVDESTIAKIDDNVLIALCEAWLLGQPVKPRLITTPIQAS